MRAVAGRRGWRRLDEIRSLGYVATLALVSLLPRRLAYPLARRLGQLRYLAWGKQRERRVAYVELRLGLGRARAEAVVRRSFELGTAEDLEYWLIPRLTRANVGRVIRFEGLEHLDAALGRGRGAVLSCGHVKGSHLCVVGLGLLGYRITLLRADPSAWPRDRIRRWFRGRYVRTIEKLPSCRLLYVDPSDRGLALGVQCVAALRRNEIVGLKPDLSFRFQQPGDVDVTFLGEEVKFAVGGALAARASGAPLLHAHLHRSDGDGPVSCTLNPPEEASGDLAALVRRQAERLEADVLADPAAWNLLLP